MKYIAIIGVIASVANVIIYWGNEAAVFGWVSSAAWGVVAVLNELTTDK